MKYETRALAGFFASDLQKEAHNIRIEAEKLNPVWQKFCQVLACRDDLIGTVLASELRYLLDACPPHDHDVTIQTVAKEMPDEKFVTPFNKQYLIGSGTIAQVYRVYSTNRNKWVALKIKHPNINSDIKTASTQYKSISSSIWFPNNLKICGDEFFKGLSKQEDFELEFVSGRKMKNIFHLSSLSSKNTPIFVVPEMLRRSDSIIIMDYEPGDCNLLSIPDPRIKDVVGLTMIYIQVASIYHGLLHSDLHWGNFSVRLNPLRIVMYDFGWVVDLSETPIEMRTKWAKAFFNRNAILIFELMIQSMKISDTEKVTHIMNIRKIMTDMKPTELFSTQIKRMLFYYQSHGLVYNDELIAIMYACIHSEQIEKISNVPSPEDVHKHLPFAEFDCLYQLMQI
ncbi:Hypothetical protein HVR_LOCUS540 [uncultured virus]|nr:Hypothetical protein HVR_LOCUS540 [uncultured virus]